MYTTQVPHEISLIFFLCITALTRDSTVGLEVEANEQAEEEHGLRYGD